MEKKSLLQWTMLLLSVAALSIGTSAGPMLLKFYFKHGSLIWLPAWMQTAGWPILIVPIWVSFSYRKKQGSTDKFHVTPMLCLASIVIGLLTGLDNFLYSWGLRYLPLSTSTVLIATQLGFNAVFAFLVIRHKFSRYSINAVILLTLSAVILSLNTKSDEPCEVTKKNYVWGFIATLGAATLNGFIPPVIELVYQKTKRQITYTLVMEMQLIMSFSSTVLCTIGMVVNNDFKAIPLEAKASSVGEFAYYNILVWNAISWQLFFVGVFGVIFLSNCLLSGTIIAVYIPINQLLAVVLYHENFTREKGVSLTLALWGFLSYLYGEHRYFKKLEEDQKLEESAHPEQEIPMERVV